MASFEVPSWWRRFLALPNESPSKTLGMAFLVSAVCAVVVSSSATLLKPMQEANRRVEKNARMMQMLRGVPGISELLQDVGAEALEVEVVDLASGRFAEDADPARYDASQAGEDERASVVIPPALDVAGLGQRARFATVYLIRDDQRLASVVVPVYGKGYQSILRGYLALESDLDTIAALAFYEHGETPGIGARITEADWQAQWAGKRAFDAAGAVVVTVAPGVGEGPHQVDGITGATRTSLGVTHLLRYWLGPHGFGPMLGRLRGAS